MIAIINIFTINTVGVLFHLLVVMGLCPLVFLNVISVKPSGNSIATITVLQKKNRFKDTLLKLACIFGSFNIKDKYTQSILWIRIQLLKIACPVTIGQSIFAVGLIIIYVQIIGFLLNMGLTVECVGVNEKIDSELEEVNRIATSVIPQIQYPRTKDDPNLCVNMARVFTLKPGYNAIGTTWPNFAIGNVKDPLNYQPGAAYKEILEVLRNKDPDAVIRYASAFNLYFMEQVRIINDPFMEEHSLEDNIKIKTKAFVEIRKNLPFFLEFQLPAVEYYVRAIKYTSVHWFYKGTIVDQLGGLNHTIPTNDFDPYTDQFLKNNEIWELLSLLPENIYRTFLTINPEAEELYDVIENTESEEIVYTLEEVDIFDRPSETTEEPEEDESNQGSSDRSSSSSPLNDYRNNSQSQSSDKLLNFSICKKEFLHQEFLKVKINKALVDQEHHYQLMAGGVMAVAIGYGIYKIAQIL